MKWFLWLSAIFLMAAFDDALAQTDGQMNFQVTTVTDGGTYSPRNVFAIWVTDAQTNFVKTLLCRAATQKRWLIKWNANSSGNEVDGISGATRQTHGTTNVTWNCRNAGGALVADGLYRVFVEFTEWNGQGPYTTAVSFMKGETAINLSPANLSRFTGMSLSYTPLNSPPDLLPIAYQSVTEGQTMSFQVIAQPTGGDPVTLTASNLPAGAFFYPTNAVGSFWWPNATPAGLYTGRFYATDNDGTSMREAILQVRAPGATALGAALGSPVILTPPGGIQNAIGDNFDMDESGGYAVTTDNGGFGDFGRVFVNYDATNLYLASEGVNMLGQNNAMILFLGLNTLADDKLNVWNQSGLPNGLDFLSNVRFSMPMDIALLLGDEWGDGQFPNFNLGDGYNFGQGVYYLSANSFVQVGGIKLAQYDGTGRQASASSNDDGDRLTKRWECAIPWTSLNAPLGIDSISEITLCGVFANTSLSGVTNRYLSGNYLCADIIYHDPRDLYNNAGFGSVTITPLSIEPRGGKNIGIVGAGPDNGGAGLVVPLSVVVTNLQNAVATFPLLVTNISAASPALSVMVSNLAAQSSREVRLDWNTTGLTAASYLLRITAGPLAGEAYTSDNVYDHAITLRPPQHDLAIASVVAPSLVAPGSSPSITVTVVNQGDYTETTTVTAYDETDGAAAGTSASFSLGAFASTNIPLSWSTAGATIGWHPLRFTVGPVAEETDLANNVATARIAVASSVVTNRILARGSSWRYHQEGLDLFPTPWAATNYYDGHWPTGTAPFGSGLPVATAFSATNHVVYFLRTGVFVDTEPLEVRALLARDDGVSIRLNGVEVLRDNVPAGTLTSATRAIEPVNGAAQTSVVVHTLNPWVWSHGRQTLAVSLHQSAGAGSSDHPWINELHYDNDSDDVNEGVEIAGRAGTDLTRYKVHYYRGSNGTNYMTTTLTGTITNQGNNVGARWFAASGVRNGPDGVALVADNTQVVEFISYEGVIVASNGPAAGMTSVNLPVFEPSTNPIGRSLQLSGTGSRAADFTWQNHRTHSRGLINDGQTIVDNPADLHFDLAIDLVVPNIPAVRNLVITGLQPQRDAFAGDVIPMVIEFSNRGNISEAFILVLVDAATGASIGSASVPALGSGENGTVDIDWNTAGWPTGAHDITAYIVQGGVTNLAGSFTGTGTVAGTGVGVKRAGGTGSIGGGVISVARSGRWAAAGEGATLSLMDMIQPLQPVRAGSIQLPGRIEAIVFLGNKIFTANGEYGVHIVDVSTPEQPVHIQTLDTPGHASDLWIEDSQLFIADGVTGLRIADISNSSQPVVLGHLVTGGSVRALAKNGPMVYLADSFEGLVVVNVANPGSPQRMGSTLEAGFGVDVILQDGKVWVPTSEGRCLLVDVTDPSAPSMTGGFVTGVEAKQGQRDGDRLYLAGTTGGLMIYDVADPTNAINVTTVPTAGSVNGLALEGSSLLLAEGEAGLRWLDADTLQVIAAISSASRGVRAAIEGDVLYVASGETGLRIYSITNPVFPLLIGSVSAISNARDVAVAGTLAGVADGNGYLYLVNVANPAAPIAYTPWPAPDSTPLHHLRISNNRALVAGFSKAWLLDISKPTAPQILGAYNAPTRITDIDLREGLAGIAAGSEGVYFLNAQDGPLSPLGSFDTVGLATSVRFEGSYAWIADASAGWLALDITTPSTPVVFANHGSPETSAGLTVEGRYLITGLRGSEAILYDRSNVLQPVEAARLSYLTAAMQVMAAGRHLAVLQDDAGITLSALGGVDEDGDGLDDAWERALVDADPNDAYSSIWDIHPDDDFDGDGLSNREEYLAGTSAIDADSIFMMQASSPGMKLYWPSAMGRTYTVMFTESLGTPFTAIASGILATPPLNTFSIPTNDSTAFYLVVVE